MEQIESQISEWRSYIARSPAVDNGDVEELEDHLRDQIADLTAAGLAEDEALLVAVKRMGRVHDLSREYAREHSDRLWAQLFAADAGEDRGIGARWLQAVLLALGAALAVQVARLATVDDPTWLLRNASLLVLPFLAGYLAIGGAITWRQAIIAATPFVIAGIAINVYPFDEGGATVLLVAAHLPVALWFALAYPYTGGEWRSHHRRMDFVRFTGEWFIYYVLIALGGGVLLALTALIIEPTGLVDTEAIFEWVLPSGAAGAVIVAAWLVESKQHVVENMAPVLTMLFTPLFAVMLSGAAIVYAFTSLGGAFDRELLGVFDALLVVVLGLVLYGVSAREASSRPGWMDRIQLVAVISALALDAMVLVSMIARIGELGLTPNRIAALGLNLVLLANLVGSAWLLGRFVFGGGIFHRLERWQTAYLPVFAIWATAVVLVIPPAFSFG